jgi:hypothetical protein
MAYAAATSFGVNPLPRISPPSKYRIVVRGLAIGLGAVAAVSAIGGSFTIAVGWVVAASVNARANLRTTGLSTLHPPADRYGAPLRASGYLSVAQISPGSVSVPNLDLAMNAPPMPMAASFPMGRLAMAFPEPPNVTGSVPQTRVGNPDTHRDSEPASPAIPTPALSEAVPLPRIRPQFALSIEPKDAFKPAPELPPIPSRTAIYDISARTVFMPNGDKLEAHSGLGEWMDDPGSIKLKNRGVTPPNTYQLTLRESLFHGVQAIRLNPVDEDKMFGRDGILAHTYMLGPSGQSNGCISFRDYQRFLQAFRRGEVDRIVVVTNSGREPVRTAARTPVRNADRYRYALNSRRSYDFREDYAAVR